MNRLVALPLLLAACGWNHLPSGGTTSLERPLWDPNGAVATVGGLYVPMPHSGQVAWVETNGDSALVDVRPAVLGNLVVAPNPAQAVAFLHRLDCPADGPSDCEPEDRQVITDVALLEDGDVEEQIKVPGAFNTVGFSHDGAYALAWLDLNKPLPTGGVVSLSSILVVDLVSGEGWPVPVGFAAERVLFTDDDARAVVLSQSEVAVVDLTMSPPARTVTFPLTLDPDQVVVPVGVELTPDGQFALISAQGTSDLYVLDLVDPSINVVSLAGAPAAMAVDALTDSTVLSFAGQARVDVLDHQFFDVTSIQLDEPSNAIVHDDGLAVLWNRGGGHDAYRLDLETRELTEYRLQNPAVQLLVAPTAEYAVVLTRPEGGAGGGAEGYYDQSPGLEILDLRPDHDDTLPYLLEGQGLGAAFVSTETTLSTLVLQQGVDYLYSLDLYTLESERIAMSAPPVAIGAVPEGPFFVTHSDGLGLVSFYDPTDGDVVEAAGFAAALALEDRPFDPEAY